MWRRDFPLAPSVLTSRAEPRRVLAVYPGVCRRRLLLMREVVQRCMKKKKKNKKFSLATLAPSHLPPQCIPPLSLPGWTFLWLSYWTSSVPSLRPDTAAGPRKGQRRRWRCPDQWAAGPASPRPPLISSTRCRTRRRAEYWRTFSSFADWEDKQTQRRRSRAVWLDFYMLTFLFCIFPVLTDFLNQTYRGANMFLQQIKLFIQHQLLQIEVSGSKVFDGWTDLFSSSQQVGNDETARNPFILDCALLLG